MFNFCQNPGKGLKAEAYLLYAGIMNIEQGMIKDGRGKKNYDLEEWLISFVVNQMHGLPIEEGVFYDGRWLSCLHELLALPRINRQAPRGSEQVARFVLDLLA